MRAAFQINHSSLRNLLHRHCTLRTPELPRSNFAFSRCGIVFWKCPELSNWRGFFIYFFYTRISVTFTLTFLWKRHHADCVVFEEKWSREVCPHDHCWNQATEQRESEKWEKEGSWGYWVNPDKEPKVWDEPSEEKRRGWGASARREVQQKESCQERSEKRLTITWFFFFLPFTDSDWGTSHHFVHSQNICCKKAAKSQLTGDLFIYLFTCLLIYTTH